MVDENFRKVRIYVDLFSYETDPDYKKFLEDEEKPK